MSFEALIIEPRSKQRLLLKNALSSLPIISNIRSFSTVEELRPLLGFGRPNTVTFISDTLSTDEVIGILKGGSNEHSSREQGLTLIVSSRSELPRRFVSRLLLQGAHGFIIEPFSVHDLDNAVSSAKVFAKLPHSIKIERLLPMLIQDSFILVDEIAAAFYTGVATEPLFSELEELLAVADAEAERLQLPLYRYIEVEKFTSPAETAGPAPEPVAPVELTRPRSPQVRTTTIRRT